MTARIEFSLLLPTRGRPAMVGRLLRSIRATAAHPERIEVVLCVDSDDPTRHEISAEGLTVRRIEVPPGEPMGAMMQRCAEASRGRLLMLLNDDVVFETPRWDEEVEAAFRRFPDSIAFVYGNDRDQGRQVPSFPIVSRHACDVAGQLCPREYLNLNIETHLRDVYRELAALGHDRVVYLGHVVFAHLHHSLGRSEPDATSVKRDPAFDSRLFLSLADDRKVRARRLMRAIEGPRSAERTPRGTEASIILPLSGDTLGLALQSLDALLRQEGMAGLEILLVPDETFRGREVLENLEGSAVVRVQRVEGRPGFAELANRGANASSSPLLIFLSNGSVPKPDWARSLVNAVQRERKAAAVGCRMLNRRNGRIHHAGLAFKKSSDGVAASHVFRGLPGDFGPANRTREVQAVSAAGMLVRKDAFLAAGGFRADAEGLESIDLCLKLRRRKSRVIYEPSAVLLYHHGPEWPEGFHRLSQLGRIGDAWLDFIEDDLRKLLRRDGDGIHLPERLSSR